MWRKSVRKKRQTCRETERMGETENKERESKKRDRDGERERERGLR